ncbi:hypothetical protein LguiB_009589 [Lonicera macranthoides]
MTIRVMKILRVCGDCHNAIKYISKVCQCEIVLRDANPFHRFKAKLVFLPLILTLHNLFITLRTTYRMFQSSLYMRILGTFARNMIWSVDNDPPPFQTNSSCNTFVDLILKSFEDLKIWPYRYNLRVYLLSFNIKTGYLIISYYEAIVLLATQLYYTLKVFMLFV